jgi:hypothetical protein
MGFKPQDFGQKSHLDGIFTGGFNWLGEFKPACE